MCWKVSAKSLGCGHTIVYGIRCRRMTWCVDYLTDTPIELEYKCRNCDNRLRDFQIKTVYDAQKKYNDIMAGLWAQDPERRISSIQRQIEELDRRGLACSRLAKWMEEGQPPV